MNPAVKNDAQERRRGPDIWIKFLRVAAIFVWMALLIILSLIDKAKPQVENFFSHLFNVTLRQSWDTDLLTYACYVSIIMLVFSIFALLVNMKRHRRKSDRYSKSIIIMIIFSIYVIYFYVTKTYF